MSSALKNILGFIGALPTLPYAIWSQRHEIVNAAFQRHVWLGREGRKAFEEHQRQVERQRNDKGSASGCATLITLMLVAALVVWGMGSIGEIRDECAAERGVLVKAPGENFWGYACIEKGKHP